MTKLPWITTLLLGCQSVNTLSIKPAFVPNKSSAKPKGSEDVFPLDVPAKLPVPTTNQQITLRDIDDNGDVMKDDNMEGARLTELTVQMRAPSNDVKNDIRLTELRPTLPMTSRATISKTDAGTLIVELPPTGLEQGAIFSGAFSVAWFSVVLPATFSGLWLFMLPFWAAGAMVAKQAVVDPFVSHRLEIGQYAWSVKSVYGGNKGIKLKERDGATDDLRGARIEMTAIVNDVPQYELKLYGTKTSIGLGMGAQVSQEELQYLADEINCHLQEMRENSTELLPPSSFESLQ